MEHAILLLGVPQIIAIGNQLPLISDLKNSPVKSRIYQVLSHSYHAGVQARELMFDHGKSFAKAAFITAQLRNLYLISLWLYAPNEISRLYKTSSQQSLFSPAGTLTVVGKNLARQWGFTDLLQQSFDPQSDSGQLVKTIAFANQITQLAENGWYTEPLEIYISQSSETLGCSEELLYKLIYRNAVIAARESMFYPIKPSACWLLDTGSPEIELEKMPEIPEEIKPVAQLSIKQKTIIRRSTHNLDKQLQTLIEMGKKKHPPQEVLKFSFKLLGNISEQSPLAFFLLDKNKTLLKSRFTANFETQEKLSRYH